MIPNPETTHLIHTTQPPDPLLTPHEFIVPMDHDWPDADSITVFAREARRPEAEAAELSWLVFLQGGPGHGSPRPPSRKGWIGRAVEDYRVLLLDQRGTGLSSPLVAQALAHLSPEGQARTFMSFRADSIVRDLDCIRRELIGDDCWSLLGQSYGGFCTVHYLSAAPQGLRQVMITGGLPPTRRDVDMEAAARKMGLKAYELDWRVWGASRREPLPPSLRGRADR